MEHTFFAFRLGDKTWLHIEFKLADLWIGAFWRTQEVNYGSIVGNVMEDLHVWICVVPCFPIHIIRSWKWIPFEDALKNKKAG